MSNTQTGVTIHISKELRLPDDKTYENKFNVKSESSGRLYVVSQHIAKRHWCCSCPSWITRRKCKHLTAIGVPNNEVPYEAKIES